MQPKEIRNIRIALGLTQEAFARRVGVSVYSVHRWETGKTRPQGLLVQRRLAQLAREGARAAQTWSIDWSVSPTTRVWA